MANVDTNRSVSIFTVDAFTDEPFRGNPAAVCLLPADMALDEDTLQQIAAEMNLSETSFIQPVRPDISFETGSEFTIRWFTPTNEVPLCGHATLASSAVVFFCKKNPSPSITFSSKSGPLLARVNKDRITLDFPLNKVQPIDKSTVHTLIQEICDPGLVIDTQYSSTTKKLLLRLNDDISRETLEGFSLDTRSLQSRDTSGLVRGVIVTVKCPADSGSNSPTYDFLSRYFAPWNGIDEDPVTGSAHTVLADYWRTQLGKTTFTARQCSKRGGDLDVSIVGDRVELSGKARIVLSGTLHL